MSAAPISLLTIEVISQKSAERSIQLLKHFIPDQFVMHNEYINIYMTEIIYYHPCDGVTKNSVHDRHPIAEY